jgi:hypothetical protein
VAKLKYLGTNCVHGEIESRLNSRDACYHALQSILSPRLQYKHVSIKIYKTIILPNVLYGCETWSLTSREEHILMVFVNGVLRRIFGTRGMK